MKDLAHHFAAVIPHKWNLVVIQLELSKGEIKAIERDEDTSINQFIAVLEQWKQSSTLPYSWNALINVLQL